ncbi:neurogenic locus notch homolog protein 1-like isoform X15 [Mercenaria mercenaria]|uniref:neurogenic locus notch homolog protein 1-like isoform X15 n=1 Tax=Mercenaria mercenaria TaxID=6596 RepID=UPI00234EB8BE|nr:neurogenic locus notch homolog protein 1-like isoform X15 [Mercenaria mercenaria]
MERGRTLGILVIVLYHCTYVYAGCDDPVPGLNDLNSRSPDLSWNGQNIPEISDLDLTEGWFHTTYNSWSYRMTDSTNKPNYTNCNTYWPIYLQDPHPDIESMIHDTPTDELTACLRDYFYPCSITYKVQIRKCNDKLHYRLQATKGFSGYCFEKHEKIGDPEPAPTDVNLGTVTVVPELRFDQIPEQRFGKNVIHYLPHIEFRCDFTSETDYFYTVNWYAGGHEFIPRGPSRDMDDLTLQESALIDNGLGLGITVRCGVRVSSVVDGLKTNMTASADFFAGVKVTNRTVYIDKNSTAFVRIKTTIPLGCQYEDNVTSLCTENLKIFDPNPHNCKVGSITTSSPSMPDNQKCSSPFQSLTKDQTFDTNVEHQFDIQTTDHTYDDKSVFNLKLQFGHEVSHRIWKNYILQDIQVIVVDKLEYKNKICYSHIDPHHRTADGHYYEMQLEGIFLLYKHKGTNVEVQIITTRCWNRPTCICAVAIRAGRDVFMINICGSINFFGFTHCGEGGILQIIKVNDNLYNIYTPTGTKITVSLLYGYINVDIAMAPKDLNNVEGLCGYFDNDISNDFRHRDGTTSGLDWKDDDFSNSWRVEDKDNLFRTYRQLTAWVDDNMLYCICEGTTKEAEAFCSPSQYLDCEVDPSSITNQQCLVTQNRKRRSVHFNDDKELERLLTLMSPVPKHIVIKRQVEETIFTEDEAMSLCTEKINGSLAMSSYSDVSGNEDPNAVISQCAFDLQTTNDKSLSEVHIESMNTIVKTIMDKEPVYVANNTEKVDIFYENTCPLNCSGRGNCSKTSECECEQFLHGADCSIDERDPLRIDDIEGGGLCDVADGDECTCFYVRSDTILDGFSCNVNTFKISVNGTLTNVSSKTLKGGYKDIFTGLCCVPENIAGTDDVFVSNYNVSISNNGENFGNEEDVYVFDSTCQHLEDDTHSVKQFTLKDGHCFIEGYCVAENEMSFSGCLACKPSTARFNWTEYNPCRNGGNCSSKIDGYTCSCVDGYGGINCEFEIDECSSSPCQNGGNCTDLFNAYSCECLKGFTGSSCETNIDECSSNPCQNGGVCLDQVNMYQCECSAGYEGKHCEMDIDECQSNPCQNDGSCTDHVNGYTCQCVPGYFGTNCSIDINDCESNPCQNGGSCVDEVNGRLCNCIAGYNGVNCELNIYECSSNPCQNGGSCEDLVNGYICKCIPGYNGSVCEQDIDECATAQCQNGGTCLDQVNGYICECAAGFKGTACMSDINECSSEPCKNGGSCTDLVADYSCTCVDGYEGTTCEIDINECSSNPCKNGGTCEDDVAGYKCICSAGYEGSVCETDINECSSEPCKNGGSCTDLVADYSCTCVDGYEGTTCEIDINECSPDPCQNGGSCEDLFADFNCVCAAGYEGSMCEIDINECSSNPCKNGGTCEDDIAGYKCICSAGYEGSVCETDINECSSETCKNGGSCTDLVADYSCTCVDGYEGTTCEIDINECSPDPCQNGGSCEDLVADFNCVCAAGYEGSMCEIDINECSSNPCKNGGTCEDDVAGYKCICSAGYEGSVCETDINECSSETCKNGGSCTDLVADYSCTCVDGYEGTTCEIDINECSPDPCQNGGSCEDLVADFNCVCAAGYEGSMCEIDINECSSNPCKNGGTCEDDVAGYKCICSAGYEGSVCETDINECSSETCKNGGSCTDLVADYSCTCVDGYEGTTCEIDINECSPDPCQNGGSCEDLVADFNCVCAAGHEGSMCEIDINECSSNPCKNGGTCEDDVAGYKCICSAGYEGSVCETDINECSSETCKNGGSCTDLVADYSCTCVDGYEGTTCEIDINECSPDPCQNGGSCEDLVADFNCVCAAGYEGSMCEIDINECSSNPCKNGGTCEDDVAGYKCICSAGYEGSVCETDINECSSETCKNGGSCTDLVADYSCTCVDGYEGTTCEIDIDNCLSNPCENGGSCVDLINSYTCICVAGYEGYNCTADIDECLSDPCKNGATCEDEANGYSCQCAAGYEDTDCGTDIDECLSDPCKNGATCEDEVNNYTCQCAAGYEGFDCGVDTNECISNPCKHGATCEDEVNGYSCQCAAGYEGTDCENDTDECLSNPCKNSATCEDKVNGYACQCAAGYEGAGCETEKSLTTSEKPLPTIARTQLVMVLAVNADSVDLTVQTVNYTFAIELTTFFKRKMGDMFKEITIFDIRYGSVVVDFEIRYENVTSAKSDLIKATLNLVNGAETLKLLNETVSAISIKIDDVTVTNETIDNGKILCELYLTLNGLCPNAQECSVVDGNRTCISNEAKSDVTLVIVVVCSIVSVIILVSIICVSIRTYRMKGKLTLSNLKQGFSFAWFGNKTRRQHSIGADGNHMSDRTRASVGSFRSLEELSGSTDYSC